MEIVIVGLGLIGGSLAKALKQNTPHRVLGIDTNDDALLDACACGAVDGKASLQDLERADVVYLAVYPQAIVEFAKAWGPHLKPGCVLTDTCGIKGEICAAMAELAAGAPYEFVAGHPMAGKEQSGFSASDPSIFVGASYILAGGNPNVILCERGIRTFETYTRNTLDLSAVLAAKQMTHLPVVVDPSHACGKAWMVERMSLAAVAAGADGLLIEVHNDPKNALCDGAQSITPAQFRDLMGKIGGIAACVGRSV